MFDDNTFNHWNPYGLNEADQAFLTALLEFNYELIESQIDDMSEFPDADAIIKRIQANVR